MAGYSHVTLSATESPLASRRVCKTRNGCDAISAGGPWSR